MDRAFLTLTVLPLLASAALSIFFKMRILSARLWYLSRKFESFIILLYPIAWSLSITKLSHPRSCVNMTNRRASKCRSRLRRLGACCFFLFFNPIFCIHPFSWMLEDLRYFNSCVFHNFLAKLVIPVLQFAYQLDPRSMHSPDTT